MPDPQLIQALKSEIAVVKKVDERLEKMEAILKDKKEGKLTDAYLLEAFKQLDSSLIRLHELSQRHRAQNKKIEKEMTAIEEYIAKKKSLQR